LLDANEGTMLDTLVAHAPGTLDIKLAFSPNGHMLASGGRDNNVHVWDIAARRDHMAATMDRTLRGHSLAIWSVGFTPDGNWIVTASEDRTVRLWNVSNSLRQDKSMLVGHTLYVLDVAFDRSGKWLASAASDNTVRIWDTSTGEERYILDGGKNWVTSLDNSPRDPLVAGASLDGRLTVWNFETGKPVWAHDGADGIWQEVAFSSDGAVLMSGSAEGIFTSYDPLTGATIDSFSHPLASWGSFAMYGNQLAVSSEKGDIAILDLQTGEDLHVLVGHGQNVGAITFSPDGRFLASVSGDGKTKIWEVNNGREIHTLSHGAAVNGIAFSSDGRILATAGKDNLVRLWDVAKGDQRAALAGHKHWVESVAFSPDGSILASCSDDRTVRLWRAANRQEAGHPAEK
jgi:WD40 repeat protein